MATTGVANRSGSITGGPGTPIAWSDSLTFTAAVGEVLPQVVNGNTTVTVPAGTTLCRIIPPNAVDPTPNPSYSGTLTLKGVNGDTGAPLSVKNVTEVAWDTATTPASIVVNASVSCTVTFVFI